MRMAGRAASQVSPGFARIVSGDGWLPLCSAIHARLGGTPASANAAAQSARHLSSGYERRAT